MPRNRALPKSKGSAMDNDKKEQYLHFNSNDLVPKFVSLMKFICSRIIPTKHTSNVIVDRAVLLFAIVKGLKLNVGKMIHSKVLRFVKPAKGLCFPFSITKNFRKVRVTIEQGNERVMPGLTMTTRKTPFPGAKASDETSYGIFADGWKGIREK